MVHKESADTLSIILSVEFTSQGRAASKSCIKASHEVPTYLIGPEPKVCSALPQMILSKYLTTFININFNKNHTVNRIILNYMTYTI